MITRCGSFKTPTKRIEISMFVNYSVCLFDTYLGTLWGCVVSCKVMTIWSKGDKSESK